MVYKDKNTNKYSPQIYITRICAKQLIPSPPKIF